MLFRTKFSKWKLHLEVEIKGLSQETGSLLLSKLLANCLITTSEYEWGRLAKKNFTSWWSRGRRPVPEMENRAAAPAQRTVFENLFGPPSCLTTLGYLWWPSEAVWGCWGRPSGLSRRRRRGSGCRRRTVRGRGRLRREFRNLKQC